MECCIFELIKGVSGRTQKLWRPRRYMMVSRKGQQMKQIRKQLQAKEWGWDAVFGAILIVQFLLWGWLNLHYQYVNDHDSAKALYHTICMWEEKTLLIPGWKYMTTAEWDCSVLPALLFYGMTGDILLSFAIANIIHVFCYTWILLKLFRNLGLRGKYAYMTASVILIPLELGMLSYANMLFYGAAQYVYKTLLPLWMLQLLTTPKGHWKKAAFALQMLLFCALTFLTAVSSGMYVFLCGLFPITVCTALFILRSEQIKPHAGRIAVCLAAGIMTLGGYALQKILGLSTYADEINLVLVEDFFPQLTTILMDLLRLTRSLPSQDISLYTVGGIMYLIRFAFLICMLFFGLKGLKGWFDERGLHSDDEEIGLLPYAGAVLSGIFVWNIFIQQITITSPRYHMIGYIPLMAAAGITFAAGTQRRSAFIRFIRYACAAGALLMMMLGCWRSIFSAAGNYHRDYHDAVMEIAQAQNADSVAFINDSASAEMARAFYPDRVSVSYFTSNSSLVNYDAYDYYDERSTLSDRHLLIATPMGGLSNLPSYLQGAYTQIGEVFGDTVYMAETCYLDGQAGPMPNRTTIDYPFTHGYIFDTGMIGPGVFDKGGERLILQSPSFPGNPSAVRVTLHYQLADGSEGAWLDAAIGEESAQRIVLPHSAQQIDFEVPAETAFSFCVGLGQQTALHIKQITFEWI